MQVQIVPLTDFVHGGLNARAGRPVMIDESTAGALERAGLVRINLAPKAEGASADKQAAGKAADDGAGRPSSVSQVAQASPTTTLHTSKAGAARHRKSGTS